jgi:hypothetical protein
MIFIVMNIPQLYNKKGQTNEQNQREENPKWQLLFPLHQKGKNYMIICILYNLFLKGNSKKFRLTKYFKNHAKSGTTFSSESNNIFYLSIK